jgi:ankyrin repeat protein
MPLHAAAANGDVTLVRLLRRAGADASAANDDGRTPRDVAENDMVIAALGEV